MVLHKTPLARTTLQHNGSALSQHERRILILCDGRRDAQGIIAMLGPDAVGGLELLQAQGYLTPASVAAPAEATPAAAAAPLATTAGKWLGRLRPTTAPSATPRMAEDARIPPPLQASASPAITVAASNTHQEQHAPGPRGTRRSLPAAKMYMLDMLQLQRSMEAASIAVSVQTSTTDGHLVLALLEALRHLHASTKASVAARIAQRLLEVIPETHLSAVELTWADLTRPAQWADPAPERSNIIPIERYA